MRQPRHDGRLSPPDAPTPAPAVDETPLSSGERRLMYLVLAVLTTGLAAIVAGAS